MTDPYAYNNPRKSDQNSYAYKNPKNSDLSPGPVSINSFIADKCKLSVFILGILLLIVIIALNVLFLEPLFLQGINFIYNYQQSQDYGWIQVIQNLISLLCEPVFIAVVLLLYYIIVNRKLMLLVHLSYFMFMIYIIAVIKQGIQQSRPIWYDERIENWEWFCPKDFGDPSGHSFAVSMLYEPIFSDCIGLDKRRLLLIPLILICVLVPISRMYLGVHSANQILFGLSFGLTSLVMFKFYIQEKLYYLFWSKLVGGPKKCIKLVIAILFNIVVIIIPIVIFVVNVKEKPMVEKDITNLNKNCKTDLTGYQVQGKMLTACCAGCFVFGLIYGFVMLSDRVGFRRYLLGFWKYQNCYKFLAKIGVYILCAGVPALTFILIGHFAVKDPIGQYILYCIGVLLGGFGLSYFAPIMTEKCNIMEYEDGPIEQHVADQEMDDY